MHIMTQEKLKNCPFCGGKAKYLEGVNSSYCMCLKCETMGNNLQSKSEAITAWNTRADKAEPAIDVEGLKKDKNDCTSMGDPNGVYADGWNDCIDHLASRNLIRTPREPIEGLEEAARKASELADLGEYDEHACKCIDFAKRYSEGE